MIIPKLKWTGLLVLFLLITPLSTFSQGEANNWFFGENVGLRFNASGKPSVSGGQLNTLEGCASISDKSGGLLFYSDGTTVWNRDNQVMPNGTDLLGDASSTQSAIIVPNPKNPDIYYLFTVGSTVNPSGFYYYTVDMSLDNGKGDISAGPVELSDGKGEFWSEKITAVETDTCDSYWVISLVDNEYYAYKVDENGVSSSPVITEVEFMSRQSRGYLKISPDGTKLASAHQGLSTSFTGLYLYSFDNVTGQVLDDELELFGEFETGGSSEAPYGVEFSPKTSKLYASTIEGFWYRLYQYDLTADDIRASRTLIHEEEGFRGALQLGPDQKIYVTIPEEYEVGTRYLDVIHNPESKGASSGFEENYIDFGGPHVMQGLPPFIQSLFITDEINIVNPYESVSETSSELTICYNDSYVLEGNDIPGADYTWTYNDGLTEVQLPTPNPPHQLVVNTDGLNSTGLYTLKIETHDDCDTTLIGEAEVTFTDPPTVNPSTELLKCDSFDSNPDDGLSYFNIFEANDALTNNDSENFSIYYYLSEGDAENDQFNQNSLPQVFNTTVPDQVIVAKLFYKNQQCYTLSEVTLKANVSEAIITDSLLACDEGESLAVFDLNQKRTDIINSNGLTGSIAIDFFENLEDALSDQNSLGNSYSGGTTALFFKVEINGICYGSGQFTAQVSSFPELNLNKTIVVCGSSFPVNLNSELATDLIANYDFTWSQGALTESIDVTSPGSYVLELKDKISLCTLTKTYEVIQAATPSITDVIIDPNKNSISVVTDHDEGNEYSLNNPFGDFQASPVFNDVLPGVYDVFVKNIYGCGVATKKVYVLGFPKFFTPNNDGINDNWEIKGLDHENFTFSDIHIFNRFGKHLTTIKPNDSWNGLYNSKFLPASDYWFSINITDNQNITKTYRGHFSLIRR